jgi:hypothetical protein
MSGIALFTPMAPAGDEAGSPGFARCQRDAWSKSAETRRAMPLRASSGLELDAVEAHPRQRSLLVTAAHIASRAYHEWVWEMGT